MKPAETAFVVNALRKHPSFRNASRRLLTDLVEDLEPTTIEGPLDLSPVEGRLIVMRGSLTVWTQDQTRSDFLPGLIVDPADYLQGKALQLRIAPTRLDRKAQFLYLKDRTLEKAMIASPTLLRSLLPGSQLNAIWVCTHDKKLPIEALTFLLGEAIGNDWSEDRVAIVLLRPDPELWLRTDEKPATFKMYRGGPAPPIDRFDPMGTGVASGEPPNVHKLAEAKGKVDEPLLSFIRLHAGTGFWHVLFANPSDPAVPPHPLETLKFHQLVYLTDKPVREIPTDLRNLVLNNNETLPGGEATRFNVFVPSILLPPDADSGGAQGGWLLPSKEKFATASVATHDGRPRDGSRAAAGAPLDRDSCRLRFDLSRIERAWSGHQDPATFPAAYFQENEPDRRRASRWARAVTDRSVGVALSGGGASAFRAVALLQELEKQGVPVDVIGGVSGGALISAYYAKEQMDGLERCVRSASDFQRASLLGMINSWFIEWQVDRDLEGARVEDLEIRLAAVAGALSEDYPPEACVVTHGRLGEAVRASGSLPLGFGPTQKGDLRFADGSTAAAVPVDFVRLLGADVVIAFNFVPGARRGNPFGDSTLGRFLYRNTPVGRVVDAWVSAAFLLRQASAESMESADVALEAQSANYPLTEMLDWGGARKIVERGLRQDGPNIKEKVGELRREWLLLGQRRDGT